VDRLRYNLLSVSQLCDANLSVLFTKSDSHVLDSSGKRVCGISRIENVFQGNFSSAQSSLRCLILQSFSVLWKWHRRLGHLSFDLLCRLSGLGLLRGLPLLKFESDLVCAPCRHGKMIAASHSLVNTVMTEHPGQLLHMDTVGPSFAPWEASGIVDVVSSDILSRNRKSATMQDQSQGRTRRVFRLVRALRRVKTLRPVLLYYEM
jgi:hypothetical protein